MTIVLEKGIKPPSGIQFVETSTSLCAPFNASSNCLALHQDLPEPLDEFAIAAYQYFANRREIDLTRVSKKLDLKDIENMSKTLQDKALSQLHRIQNDIALLEKIGCTTSLKLIWGASGNQYADDHPHHDVAWDTDDLRLLRRFLCNYTQLPYATTGYRNEDVRLDENLFLNKYNKPVLERTEETQDIFYQLNESVEGHQFPLGTIFGFAFGRERKENSDRVIKPYVHVATQITEARLAIPRVLLVAQWAPHAG